MDRKVLNIVVIFVLVQILLSPIIYADFGVNASDYEPSWEKAVFPPKDLSYTKYEVYKGEQFKGWSIYKTPLSSSGKTPEGIDPEKEYVVVKWGYDFGKQKYPEHEKDVEPVFAVVDPDSKEALYYGRNWHYMPLLDLPYKHDPADLKDDPVDFSANPITHTPIPSPFDVRPYLNTPAALNPYEWKFIDNAMPEKSEKDRKTVKRTVDLTDYAYKFHIKGRPINETCYGECDRDGDGIPDDEDPDDDNDGIPDEYDTGRNGEIPSAPGGDHPDDTTAVGSSVLFPSAENERLFRVLDQKIKEKYPGGEELIEHLKATEFEYLNLSSEMNLYFENNQTPPDWLLEAYTNASISFMGNLDLYVTLGEYIAPDIAVLKWGFYEDNDRFTWNLGEGYRILSFKDFDLDIVEYQKVLIIPSGGLYGLDSSKLFKAKLEEYVAKGGTLVVFAQQRGYEYNALPGSPSGEGWLEDQSCHSRAVYIDTYHPVLSGQDSETLDIGIDGYFTSWPENSTILLKRTKNGQPAMIMYPFGNGTVIATTAYTDWAYGHGQATGDGISLVRDTLAWAREPKAIEDFASGVQITMPIEVTNDADSAAEKVTFTVIDPDKNIIGTVNVTTAIGPGETTTVNFTYTVPLKLGIYYVDYSLVNATGEIVKNSYEAARFAVSLYKANPDGFTYQGSNLQVWASAPERVIKGTEVPFKVYVRNDGETNFNGHIAIGGHEAKREGGIK